MLLRDLTRDSGAGSFDEFYARSLKNQENRCFHHHLFSPELLVQICDYFFFKVIHIAVEPPYNIIVLAEKVDKGCRSSNADNLGMQGAHQRVL